MPQNLDGAGRFAPSPSGDLHVGNLRTAILAWLFARSTGRRFLLRIEDLDRARAGAEASQLADLAAVGLDWDTEVVRQTDRTPLYRRAIVQLAEAGLAYECFCTRREIADAPSAPHAPAGAYPGTCRDLTDGERERRRQERPAALRLKASVSQYTVIDQLHGPFTGAVDDFVLLRNDGVPAYNLAVVVDDAAQGIDQVVRGDDLLSSAPRQAYLAALLGLPEPHYAHVPLVLNVHHRRLAKRDGAVTLSALALTGFDAGGARDLILRSLGLPAGPLERALEAFDPAGLPREPWIFEPPELPDAHHRANIN
ncbi:glutamyl- or glutaminyl-tRNA synthetase [Arthrobacter crystallopoietes BAB-32]|uniref:Glutamyl-Q tRNA(Asp) synthetase n=1 Tax=Arthrobacter crystallopoietes BAB-32 TaxID=1246476 RepID=N1V3R2_9MICC|nr:tRNA glutamyl-Q(34) synthetase GluQRS [Arthrobacter crystallopoietes]EMY32873.1 glutamyl- or glutaminyl-tRNA synthetase [Arthrobacter crystallopoietes BAB-32]